MKLRTKLVLAITALVFAVVASFAYVYVSQMVRSRIVEADSDGEFLAYEIYNAARVALEVDLTELDVDPGDPKAVAAAVRESLETDPGLNNLLQSIVGYSPIVFDALITDSKGIALLHTSPDLIGTKVEQREPFSTLRAGDFRDQLRVIYDALRVYEIRLPLKRGNEDFGEVRIGISTTFLKNELRPQLRRALIFSAFAIFFSIVLAAVLSTIALRPIQEIGQRLDRIAEGDTSFTTLKLDRTDEFGVVNYKIARLGKQMRDAREVFSALKENLDQLMANLQDGLMLFTRDARAVLVSASAEQFVGRPRSEMLGCSVEHVFEGGTELDRAVLRAFSSRIGVAAMEVEGVNGRRVQVSVDFIAEDGEQIGALVTMRDAESVRQIESEIELSRRLASIGRLTSGVAHEVKNPINAIVVHLEILREKMQATDPDTLRHMDVIGSEIERLSRVVQTLVDFTRPVELRLVELDLRRIIEDVALLARPEAEQRGVTILHEVPAESITVKADADLVKQAVLNVVINGVQAMSAGGELRVVARGNDGHAEISISDQGPGIPLRVREKVFNLYFTTKKKGSGIGLAMTYRVMQLHNGSVEFDTQEGLGTTFHLRLPLSHGAAETAGVRS